MVSTEYTRLDWVDKVGVACGSIYEVVSKSE